MFNFEKLDTWRDAIEFADLVYQLTRGFPDEERFGLTSQMRRAAVSISSNVAEGCSRSSRADYARFVEIATGSVFEVVSQATIGRNQGFLQARGLPIHLRSRRETKPDAQRPAPLAGIHLTLNSQPSTLNHRSGRG